MKLLVLSILFLLFLQSSFAQKYEYDIIGRVVTDTLPRNPMEDIKIIIAEDGEENALEKTFFHQKELNFEGNTLDSNYIYHKVGEGENIEYILDLYQICEPCFAEWNNFECEYREFPIVGEEDKQLKTILIPFKEVRFEDVKLFQIYEGEYLKVALKKDYEKGIPTESKKGNLYQNFKDRIHIYYIAERYKTSIEELRLWNNLDSSIYYVENTTLIVRKIEYKYACPCFETQN